MDRCARIFAIRRILCKWTWDPKNITVCLDKISAFDVDLESEFLDDRLCVLRFGVGAVGVEMRDYLGD